MNNEPLSDRIDPRRGVLLVASIALAAVLLAAVQGFQTPASAAVDPAATSAQREFVVLGDSGPMPAARCPEQCLGVATVTGFQTTLAGMSAPYRVPFDGEITAWKLGLGKPSRSQREFFETRFGDRPTAGLAVLKKVRVDGKVRYLLRKRSPIEGLNRVLGTVASFKLKNPIRVNRGNLIALTVPTWAPAMAMPDGITATSDAWRTSRSARTCSQQISTKTSRPQQKIGSKRPYGCLFDNARLLYRVKVASR